MAASDGHYSTRLAYKQLMKAVDKSFVEEREEFKIIWNKWIASKVCIHAWRVLWERLPTTLNLHCRNALPPQTTINCPFCGVIPESVRHVLFECDCAYQLWMECINWFGLNIALSSKPAISLLHFSSLLKVRTGGPLWFVRGNALFGHCEKRKKYYFSEYKGGN